MSDSLIETRYRAAKEIFAEHGIDTDKALTAMETIPVSVHCWQIDDLTGLSDFDAKLTGGIQATGNMGGKPKSEKEYFEQLSQALELIPGCKKVAVHAVYLQNFGREVDRDQIEPKHFEYWVEFARKHHYGLDFNPTYFSHPKLQDNFTLSSADEEVRQFWVEHGRRSRKIGEFFGKELGVPCITNHWIPDGYKDKTVDTLAPRLRLIKSLNEMFEEPIEKKYNVDSLESKLFGLGIESYTVGSHEFYTNYCNLTGKAIVCMDTGHFHPTESVAAKLSSYLAFGQEIMLHLSRPVRWDSDHVVLNDDETRAIMEEIVRCGATQRVHIGLDFFDASINRIAGTAIGGRNAKKCLLQAVLQPVEELKRIERSGNLSKRLATLEELKDLPYGPVWDMYCHINNCKTREWIEEIL